MSIIRASDDFHDAAERVRTRVADLAPAPGRNDVWQHEIKVNHEAAALVRLYNKDEVGIVSALY